MGRAFLTTQYLAPSPPPAHKAVGAPHRWSAKAFDPDQEDIDGLDMVYEAVVDPTAAVPESAVRTPLTVSHTSVSARMAVVTRDSVSSDDDSERDNASDSASTAVSSPSSVSSNEAQQLAALQRRLFGGEARSRSSTAPGASASVHVDAARRMQDHIANISSLRAPARRSATLSTLDLVTRPAVAQPI